MILECRDDAHAVTPLLIAAFHRTQCNVISFRVPGSDELSNLFFLSQTISLRELCEKSWNFAQSAATSKGQQSCITCGMMMCDSSGPEKQMYYYQEVTVVVVSLCTEQEMWVLPKLPLENILGHQQQQPKSKFLSSRNRSLHDRTL